MRRIIRSFLFLITTISLSNIVDAQFIPGGFSEFAFVGRHPNARFEAMGRTGVAGQKYTYNALLNPAAIGGLPSIIVNYAQDPDEFYLIGDDWFSDYKAIGGHWGKLAMVFDIYSKSYGKLEWIVNSVEEKIELFSLSSAYKLTSFLQIGAAMRVPRWRLEFIGQKSGLLLD